MCFLADRQNDARSERYQARAESKFSEHVLEANRQSRGETAVSTVLPAPHAIFSFLLPFPRCH